MVSYSFSAMAYAKIIFHAAKYPHLSINGVLLGEKSMENNCVQIVDAIPLFHQCLYVTPMIEIAMVQVESFAEKNGLVIAGYYAGAEYFFENSVDRAPAGKIADRIQEFFDKACFTIINNRLMTVTQSRPALKVHCKQGSTWTATEYTVENTNETLKQVSNLLKCGAMKDLVDFDNHLDNPQNDWTNKSLNIR